MYKAKHNAIGECCLLIDKHLTQYLTKQPPRNAADLVKIRELFSLLFLEPQVGKEKLEMILKTTSSFLKVISRKICSFFDSEKESTEISNLLIILVKCNIANKLGAEFTDVVRYFYQDRFENHCFYQWIFPFLEEYFKSDTNIEKFKESGCLETIFSITFRPNTRELCQLVFSALSAKMELLVQGIDNKSYSGYLANAIPTINAGNTDQVISFISTYLSMQNVDVVNEFITNNGFINANTMIVSDVYHGGIKLYSDAPELIEKTKNEDGFPIFKAFMNLFYLLKEEEKELIEVLFSIFQSYTKSSLITSCFVNSDDIYLLFSKIVSNKCLLILCKSLKTLSVRFGFPIEKYISSIAEYLTPEFLIQNDANYLFELCERMLGKDYATVLPFVARVFANASEKEFVEIMVKYSYARLLYPLMFAYPIKVTEEFPGVLEKFFISELYQKNEEVYCQLFCDIYGISYVRETVIKIMESANIDAKLSIVHAILVFISKIKITKTIELVNDILSVISLLKIENPSDKCLVLNILAALSHHCFNEQLDKIIAEHLEENDFYKAGEEEIRKLSFGIKQEEEPDYIHYHLCYPSILYKCGTFSISSYYDSIVCSLYAIDKWIEKTGKQITEFPDIKFISKVFLTPNQARMLLKYPLFSSVLIIRNPLCIPLFEFTKNYEESNFTIPVTICKNKEQGASFWFMFQERPAKEQRVFRFGPVTITVDGESLFCNGKSVISTFHLNAWIFVFILITEDHFTKVYFNNNLLFEEQIPFDDIKCEIGSTECYANWCIGSAVRIFKGMNISKVIKEVFEKEAGCTSFISKNEVTVYTPGLFVNCYNGKIDRTKISDNTMPVINQNINFFISSFLSNELGLFKKIFQLIAEDGDRNLISDYFILLISLFKTHNSKISPEKFSLLMSCIINLVPEIFTKEKMGALISKQIVDEKSFLSFFQDPAIYHMPFVDYNISLFRQIKNIRFKKSKYFIKFQRFLISLLLSVSKEVGDMIFDLLVDLGISGPFLFRWIPLFIGNQFFDKILDETLKYVDENFTAFHLISFLPPEASTKILYKYATSFPECSPPKMKQIMRLCMLYCDQIYAWSTAFSIVIKTKINLDETNYFEFDIVNQEVLPEFFIMTSILLAANSKLNEKFKNLLDTLVGFIKLITQDLTFSKDEMFALVQMLSFCKFSDGFIVFPFAPSFTSVQTTCVYSRRRGQIFPEHTTYADYKSATLDDIDPPNETVIEAVHANIPATTSFSPTNVMDNTELIDNLIEENLQDANLCSQWLSWKDFAMEQVKKFIDVKELEEYDIETSLYFLEIVQFVVNGLVERIDDPNFIDYFTFITMATGMLEAKQSRLILSKIVLNTLTECSAKSLYSESLINFIVERVIEGWLANSYAPVLSLILQIMTRAGVKELTDNVLGMCLQGFEIVPPNQFHIFSELFLTYFDYIFSETNVSKPSFVILLLDRIVIHYTFSKDSFSVLLDRLKEKVATSALLRVSWEQLHTQQKIELPILIEIIEAISKGRDGRRKWVSEHKALADDFDGMRLEFLEQFSSSNLSYLCCTLENVIKERTEFLRTMEQVGNKYIFEHSTWKITSTIIGKTINEYCTNILQLDEAYFFREREAVLLNMDTLDVSSESTECFAPLSTIFSNAFYHVNMPCPSKERYEVKNLPSIDSLPYARRSNNCKNLVTSPLRSILFCFSDTFAQKKLMKTKLIEMILNNSKPFEFIIKSSLLFEGEELNGRLFGTEDAIYFWPGESAVDIIAERIIAKWFGDFIFYEGTPIIKISLIDICNICPHIHSDKTNSINIILMNGITLLFIVPTDVYNPYIKNVMLEFRNNIALSLPEETKSLSIVNNAKLAMKPFNVVLGMWRYGEIDNYTFISYINYHRNRLIADPYKYPVYPRIKNRNFSTKLGVLEPEKVIKYQKSLVCEETPYELYDTEDAQLLYNSSDITTWINKVFGPNTEYFVGKKNCLRQNIDAPLQKPEFLHIMSVPHKIFWFSIKVEDFSYPSRVQIVDNHVFVHKNISIVVPPSFNSILTIGSNQKQLINFNMTPDKSPFEIIAHGAALKTVIIFEISNDALYYAFGHFENVVTFGRIVYSKSKIANIKLQAKIFIPDKPTSIAISSAHFIVCVSCAKNVQVISLATNSVLRQIDVGFEPIKVLIDDYAAEIIVVGSSEICIYDMDFKLKKSLTSDEEILCAAISQLPLYVPNRFFVTGHINGAICFWSNGEVIRKLETGLDDIKSISIDQHSQRIAFCTDKGACIISFFGNTSKPLTDDHAYACSRCGRLISKKHATCSSCHRFFCLTCSEQNKIIKDLIKKNVWICPDCK